MVNPILDREETNIEMLIHLFDKKGFSHSKMITEYLLKVYKMEVEDKFKTGPYAFGQNIDKL